MNFRCKSNGYFHQFFLSWKVKFEDFIYLKLYPTISIFLNILKIYFKKFATFIDFDKLLKLLNMRPKKRLLQKFKFFFIELINLILGKIELNPFRVIVTLKLC